MDKFLEVLITIFSAGILFAIWFVYSYLKKLPDQVHKKNLKAYEFELSQQLEDFKNGFTRELEMKKITESNLYLHKAKEFSEFIEFFNTKLMNKDYIKKLDRPQIQKELHEVLMRTVTKFFFFASDETVKKFVEWRRLSLANKVEDGFKVVYIMAQLIVLMRKDLGYENTLCDEDDVLYLILTDWNEEKSKEIKSMMKS